VKQKVARDAAELEQCAEKVREQMAEFNAVGD
jgi:hypothetical protein